MAFVNPPFAVPSALMATLSYVSGHEPCDDIGGIDTDLSRSSFGPCSANYSPKPVRVTDQTPPRHPFLPIPGARAAAATASGTARPIPEGHI